MKINTPLKFFKNSKSNWKAFQLAKYLSVRSELFFKLISRRAENEWLHGNRFSPILEGNRYFYKELRSRSQIFFALGVPVDIPNKSVLFSLYFEANYPLPGEWNSSYYFEEPYFRKRSVDRRLAYDVLVNKLDR